MWRVVMVSLAESVVGSLEGLCLRDGGESEALAKTLHVTPAIPMNNSEHRWMYGGIRQDTEAWNLASSNKKKKGNRRKKKSRTRRGN